MIVPSLERLYLEINKHILLAQSYTEISNLSFIIKACRLKPYNILLNKDMKLVLHKLWVDEFGNSLKIIKNKRIKIIYNDLSLDRDKIIGTDLYCGLNIEKIIKISKMAHIYSGTDDGDKYCCITFLGIDNYLRSYINMDDEWQTISPLVLGMRRLKDIARHLDIKYFLELKNKGNSMLPCATAREWITFIPPSEDFLQIVKREYDDSFSFLNIKGN